MKPVDQCEISRNTIKPAFCGARALLMEPAGLPFIVWHPHNPMKHYYSYGAGWDASLAGCRLSPVLLAGEFGMSWPLLASGFTWRCVYFPPSYTVCLQPSCVVCPQLHLHLNLVGSLPWVGASPCLTPPPPVSSVFTHGHTLVSLSSCQVCSVCVWGRIEWVIILGMGNTGKFFLNRPFSELAERQAWSCTGTKGAAMLVIPHLLDTTYLSVWMNRPSPPTHALLFV